MTLIEAFKQELELEAVTTRKFLKLLPEDKYSWQPHRKSMSVIALATHIAELPSWVTMVVNTDHLDFQENPYQPAPIKSNSELLAYYEKNHEEAKKNLDLLNDENMEETWTLRNGADIYVACPKRDMIRTTYSQIIHHRAQLGVFLRLLDIPIPGSYGPSADEMEMQG